MDVSANALAVCQCLYVRVSLFAVNRRLLYNLKMQD